MTQTLIRRNIKLSHEFDSYVACHPRLLDRIPNKAEVVITSAKDKKLSEANLNIIRNARTGRFVVAHKKDGRWSIVKEARKTKARKISRSKHE